MRKIFVFGSNRQGRHGKGAAAQARMYHGAEYGKAEGLQGDSYAIITKELRSEYPPVSLEEISSGVNKFLGFARANPHWCFEVATIGCDSASLGCGLVGFKPEQIAPLFLGYPDNVQLPEEFLAVLYPET